MDASEKLGEINEVFRLSKKLKPEITDKFLSFMESTLGNGSLDVKTKELIALSLSLALQCEWCIPYHTAKCLEAGCSEEEMIEASYISAIMAGTPALMNVKIMADAIEQLKNK
ncbi:carboxymuconolactone decarboxylase family protein [Thermoplasma sp. Kam2015]|uniref:carboxymuconolactone decarboxylase family protein n=1 Tax=Thermoplasma sp. Kam2015 TaxID=2094122 RepID=UPI000D9B404F|nr:carboxymuconolactone decarboxylase family protein [Thermoplasma sp. Kam2015]PYB68964.1 carboxymuconolactone decarboxylase family protein [Thermoplasma sp. Kam2015]